MRILIISDIHANLTAFDAVLESAGDYDEIWCLGDTVGYGPDPNECIERLREQHHLTCLIGNHDAAALGNIDLNSFNREARSSAHWTKNVLNDESREFLLSLPERAITDSVTLAHGSPRSPVWEYLLDPVSAVENLAYFNTKLCCLGHTHIPIVFQKPDDQAEMIGEMIKDGDGLSIEGRMFLNPGSVGQPRDHDPRAAYAIYNPETRAWHSHRIAYDVQSVQNRMRKAGLPIRLVQRLEEGW